MCIRDSFLMRFLLALCFPALIACTSESPAPDSAASDPATDAHNETSEELSGMTEKAHEEEAPMESKPTEPAMDPLEGLRAHIGEFSAKSEHTDPVVKVQHLLVSFAGAGTGARRSREEAEQLAGELFARIQAGEDFDALVKQHTDDSHPGIYTMTLGSPASGQYSRYGMVPARQRGLAPGGRRSRRGGLRLCRESLRLAHRQADRRMNRFALWAGALGFALASCSRESTPAAENLAVESPGRLQAELACGQCVFGLPGEGCDLAVRIDGETFYCDGAGIDDFGDAHAADGLCNAAKAASVAGVFREGRFQIKQAELVVKTP